MISVTVDGAPFQADLTTLKTMGELVEFIKVQIDPDSVIVSILLDTQDLSEAEWRATLASLGDKALSVTTGSKEQFVADRLDVASIYVDRIRAEFLKVQQAFKQGASADSHTKLANAVQDLKAFVDWYETIIQMLPESKSELRQGYHDQVRRITDVCEQLLQQQLYRAWWALAETIERKLDPELERLKGCCLKAVNG